MLMSMDLAIDIETVAPATSAPVLVAAASRASGDDSNAIKREPYHGRSSNAEGLEGFDQVHAAGEG
jgi:hypothetical protein